MLICWGDSINKDSLLLWKWVQAPDRPVMRLRRIISYKHTKTVFTEKNFSLIVKKWDLLVDGSRARCHVASIRAAEGAAFGLFAGV
jgi:hypothetical protein